LKAEAPESATALGLYLQGFTTEEVGNLLGWTEAKARNTIYRFLEQIRSNHAGHRDH
jgi:DNA-directed RNA polymerase specialized sigma24 family protein